MREFLSDVEGFAVMCGEWEQTEPELEDEVNSRADATKRMRQLLLAG